MEKRKRRVPKCKINWACIYRSDLCRSKCSAERTPRDDFMIIDGDDCYMKHGDRYIRYKIPKETKQFMMRFDRGDDEDNLVGTYITLLPPSSSKRSCATVLYQYETVFLFNQGTFRLPP